VWFVHTFFWQKVHFAGFHYVEKGYWAHPLNDVEPSPFRSSKEPKKIG
jgi:hypothetical protein